MKILIISPHPDNETLGCGGTILKLFYRRKLSFFIKMKKVEI